MNLLEISELEKSAEWAKVISNLEDLVQSAKNSDAIFRLAWVYWSLTEEAEVHHFEGDTSTFIDRIEELYQVNKKIQQDNDEFKFAFGNIFTLSSYLFHDEKWAENEGEFLLKELTIKSQNKVLVEFSKWILNEGRERLALEQNELLDFFKDKGSYGSYFIDSDIQINS